MQYSALAFHSCNLGYVYIVNHVRIIDGPGLGLHHIYLVPTFSSSVWE